MSGFLGALDRTEESVDRSTLEAMLDRIDHRGPDGTGWWLDESIALGHQHLDVTPQSPSTDPPLRNEDGTLVLTGDYRLDNRSELCSKLAVDRLSEGQVSIDEFDHVQRYADTEALDTIRSQVIGLVHGPTRLCYRRPTRLKSDSVCGINSERAGIR